MWAERAAAAGLYLAVTVAWSLDPARVDGVRDVVAVFRELDRAPPRQVAWAYASAAALVNPPPPFQYTPRLNPTPTRVHDQFGRPAWAHRAGHFP